MHANKIHFYLSKFLKKILVEIMNGSLRVRCHCTLLTNSIILSTFQSYLS